MRPNLTPNPGFVWRSGDTMTGVLTLAADPASALQAATKQYVDAQADLGCPQAILRDEKASGSAGGGFTSGAWQTRTLQTEALDEIGITLASNEFALPAGTYDVFAVAPGFNVGVHKARLYNVTDAAEVVVGTNEGGSSVNNITTRSIVEGRFTVPTGGKTYRLEHRGNVTKATDGFGQATSFGNVEVYATVHLWKRA